MTNEEFLSQIKHYNDKPEYEHAKKLISVAEISKEIANEPIPIPFDKILKLRGLIADLERE